MTPLRRLLALALIAGGLLVVSEGQAYACVAPEVAPTDVTQVVAYCSKSGAQIRHDIDTAPTNVVYRVVEGCQEMPPLPGNSCLNPRQCIDPPGSYLYWVERSNDGGSTWFWHARACLTDSERDSLHVISWRQVWARMKTLSWPSANLQIQPPDGRTLVNLATNFFTDTKAAPTQTVSIAGQQLEITATPVDYRWHFGDGTTQTGPDPGAEYPALRITHVYTEAGITVRPSVDVTYHGSYTINGGDPTDIPQELTVTGTPVALDVVSATPRLVG